MTKSTSKGRLYMVAAALLWGLAGVCVKSITWSSFAIMAVRSIISLIMLLSIKRSLKLSFTKTNITGAVVMCLTGMLYMQAIKLTTAGSAIVLQYIAPILVFLFNVIFCHRKAKVAEILITAGVFAGIVLSFADSIDVTHIVGNLLGLASGVTFAVQIIIMNRKEANSEDITMMGNFLCFIVGLPFLLLDGTVSFTVSNIVWVLILGIFQYGLANIFFSLGIQKVDSVEGSLILTLEPIFNPIPVAIFCGEMMGTKAIIGAAIVIVCVALHGLLPTLEARKENRKAAAK